MVRRAVCRGDSLGGILARAGRAHVNIPCPFAPALQCVCSTNSARQDHAQNARGSELESSGIPFEAEIGRRHSARFEELTEARGMTQFAQRAHFNLLDVSGRAIAEGRDFLQGKRHARPCNPCEQFKAQIEPLLGSEFPPVSRSRFSCPRVACQRHCRARPGP